MNCPKCGIIVVPDQKFCRSCGAVVTNAGRGNALVPETPQPADIMDERAPRFRPMQYGFIMVFLGVATALVGSLLLHQDIVRIVGIFTMLAGMFLIGYPIVSPRRPRKRTVESSPQPDALPRAETTRKLPAMSNLDFVPSVTEGTTELLKTPVSDQTRSR